MILRQRRIFTSSLISKYDHILTALASGSIPLSPTGLSSGHMTNSWIYNCDILTNFINDGLLDDKLFSSWLLGQLEKGRTSKISLFMPLLDHTFDLICSNLYSKIKAFNLIYRKVCHEAGQWYKFGILFMHWSGFVVAPSIQNDIQNAIIWAVSKYSLNSDNVFYGVHYLYLGT